MKDNSHIAKLYYNRVYKGEITGISVNGIHLKLVEEEQIISGFLPKENYDSYVLKYIDQLSRGDWINIRFHNTNAKGFTYFSRRGALVKQHDLLIKIESLEKDCEDQKDLVSIHKIKHARLRNQFQKDLKDVNALESKKDILDHDLLTLQEQIDLLQQQLQEEKESYHDQLSQKKEALSLQIEQEEKKLNQQLMKVKNELHFYTASLETDGSPPPTKGQILVDALTSAFYHHENIKLKLHPHLVREFLASLASSQLTILSGPSGTGKSAICRALETLKLASVLICPVQSNWTSSAQLLGYHNPLSAGNDKAWVHTPFYSFLKTQTTQAKKGQSKGLSLTVLDEMNIAFVEHYLAELLSRLSEVQRPIDLPLPGDPNDGSITIHQDFRLVGTVNMDETTHQLSPKVIDRSAVLRFENPLLSDKELPSISEEARYWLTDHSKGIPKIGHWLTQSNTPILSFEDSQEAAKHKENIKNLEKTLLQLNREILKYLGPDVPYSFRTLDHIRCLASYLLWLGASFEQALDSVIRLKILPRLRFFSRSTEIHDKMNDFTAWLQEKNALQAKEIVQVITKSAQQQGGAYNFWLY